MSKGKMPAGLKNAQQGKVDKKAAAPKVGKGKSKTAGKKKPY